MTDKDKFKERMEKYDNGTTVPNLATQVVDMLPTPTKFDYNTPRSQEAWDNAKEKHGDALQNPLKQMAAFGMLPTPVATDVEGGAVSNVQNDGRMSTEERQGREVGSEATRRRGVGFATDTYNGRKGHQVRTGRDQFESSDANATDAMRSRTRQDNRQGEPRQPQKDAVCKLGRLPNLSPLFVEEMMGFPRNWTASTFSKWRRESIKAYGNAIVPQVAVQIFKAIQECETLYCKA